MYNFGLIDDEKVIEVFDDIWVREGNNEKNTTIALTNKRLLFMAYDKYDSNEVMRIARGVDYMRFKEVYYKINIADISSIETKENYVLHLKDNTELEFDNDNLFKLMTELLKETYKED